MEYTALYRKYRPRRFAGLVGQEHVAKTLLNALKQDRIAHAYLFCGPRGTGKTSAAQILSRAVNCLEPEGQEPCGQCEACRRILAGNSLDILEIDAASNRGIDEMRDLRERVKYTPVQERYKVYIIDEVHMLTMEAFNALLKTLEEPPAHVIFILATTEPHKVPVTVLSRCQRFDFHRVGQKEIEAHLQRIVEQEGMQAAPEALALIARRAEGGLRDAVSLLDQCLVAADGPITVSTITNVLGIVDETFVAELAVDLARYDGAAVMAKVETLVNEGRDLRQFLQQLLEFIRQQLLLGIQPKPGQRVMIPSKRALQLLRDLVDGDQRLRNSVTPRLTLEIALLTAARLEQKMAAEQSAGANATTVKPAAKPAAPVAKQQTPVAQPMPKQQMAVSDGLLPASLWQAILQQVHKSSVVCCAYLKMAVVQRLQGDVLTLAFAPEHKIHRQAVEQPENKEKIEQAASAVLGRWITIETAEENAGA